VELYQLRSFVAMAELGERVRLGTDRAAQHIGEARQFRVTKR
jgi:hypothetical protein